MSVSQVVIRELTKKYGGMTALDGVSLAVAAGEFVALLGPSGCGKTTLLRCIAGFVTADSGDIQIDGKPMAGIPPNKRPVNTVFQSYALFPHMTVGENVAFGPRRGGLPARQAREIAHEALETVSMGEFSGRYPAQLSGGQQQRVALARAIAAKPRVLLLDEPLSALDLQLRKRMQFEIKQLQKKLGITFIFVTHDQTEALVMADRIAVMGNGRIVQLGSGREIYDSPQNRYVASFIGDANLIRCTVTQSGKLRVGLSGEEFQYETGLTSGADVVMMVRPEAISIYRVGEGTGVSLQGQVRQCAFVGNSMHYYVQLTDGTEIVAEVPSQRGQPSIEIGTPVTVCWSVDAAQLIRD